MPDAAIRSLPPVPVSDWMKAIPGAMRFVLHGDAQVRAAAAAPWQVGFAEDACRARVQGARATLWLGPDEYLLLGFDEAAKEATLPALQRALGDLPHALVDVGHRQFALEVSGPHAADILSGACPLDLDLGEFPVEHVHPHRAREGRPAVVACPRGCVSSRGVALVQRLCDRIAQRNRHGVPRRVSARARAVMVCGTTSGAGKSFLATALARWYSRRGFKVAPFKAQNMSNNARVVAGGEMGSAQYFQALAARCVPEVRMNPVLLKPETDTHSQVILLGRRCDDLSRMPWQGRALHLWPTIRSSLDELLDAHEVVIIEGAGSPAEINLAATDIVNMRVAEAAAAATLVVCDIDRGGAFAHLFGTHQLLGEAHRALIRGFVLNKFRGDPELLAPGPQMLQSLTGVPTLAVLPMWREHGLPEEDGVFDARPVESRSIRGHRGLSLHQQSR